jgi:hypothetical protein
VSVNPSPTSTTVLTTSSSNMMSPCSPPVMKLSLPNSRPMVPTTSSNTSTTSSNTSGDKLRKRSREEVEAEAARKGAKAGA